MIFGQELPETSLSPKEADVQTATICYLYPDHHAYFPNGTEAFIQRIKNLILLEFLKTEKSKNIIKATLSFIIEKDGSMREIKVFGPNKIFNQSVEKTISRINGKWIPARQDGNTVRSGMQIPFDLNLK